MRNSVIISSSVNAKEFCIERKDGITEYDESTNNFVLHGGRLSDSHESPDSANSLCAGHSLRDYSLNHPESILVGWLGEGMAQDGTTHLAQFGVTVFDGSTAQHAQRYQGSLGNGRPSDEVLDKRQGQTLYQRLLLLGGKLLYDIGGLSLLRTHYPDALTVKKLQHNN